MATQTNEKDREKIKYPPFPTAPPNVTIIPFADFKEHGIRIVGLTFGDIFAVDDDSSEGVEVDGLGIPTISLLKQHDTDACKTNSRRKGRNESRRKEKEKEANEKKLRQDEAKERAKDKDMLKKMDPIERAQEMKKRRLILFAKQEWYELWREGEDLRGKKTYDADMPIVDRIHLAATEFRTGRTWPPASTRVGYLWDQFRLYAGLLGSPPIWYRTDLEQEPEDVLDDAADYDDEPAPVSQTTETKQKANVMSDDEFEDDNEEETSKPSQEPPQTTNHDPLEHQRKRIPARTPYALYNLDPVPVKSDAEVKMLIRLGSLRKHTKLLTFLADPETSVKIFLTWYARKEGLVWTYAHLNALPRLLVFFLELLLRMKAIPESERSLRKAVEVAKRGVDEVPNTWKLCKNLPDKLGMGCKLLWGTRWVEEPFTSTTNLGEDKEALARFEAELKAENVQLVPADGELPTSFEFDGVVEVPPLPATDISIQVMSPTSPGFVEPDTPSFPIEEFVAEKDRIDDVPLIDSQTSPLEGSSKISMSSSSGVLDEITESQAIDMDERPVPPRWDRDPAATVSEAEEIQSFLDAWNPPCIQPLTEILGMSVFPLQYEPGLVERSIRKVRAVIAPGERVRDKDVMKDQNKESTKKLEDWMERKWKGVQEEMVNKLTRVVLEPWTGFDDGGCADDYRTPKVQTSKMENGADPSSQEISRQERSIKHDPEKETIVILMEPRVAENLRVGMGLAGTWVQILRKARSDKEHKPDERREGGGYRGRGRGGRPSLGTEAPIHEAKPTQDNQEAIPLPSDSHGHHGRGRGRGRGRGGFTPAFGQPPQPEFVFWYVEELFMAIPSFWTVGEEEEPLKMPGSDEEGEGNDEYPDELED